MESQFAKFNARRGYPLYGTLDTTVQLVISYIYWLHILCVGTCKLLEHYPAH